MSKHHHDALLARNLQVPRYTSYPTAPQFTGSVDARVQESWLRATPKGQALSLYFHIPFCKKMCWYCGCNTKATLKYAPVQKYLGYLKREIALVAGKMEGRRRVDHIHFGGGSPSYLTADDFTGLMQAIREHFDVSETAEIAVELDPREITEPKVAAYRLAGVNRASLGVQDFDSKVQKAINRVQPVYQIYDAVRLLRAYGIDGINMDLLYGLPHQNADTIRRSVDLAAALTPTRISLFGYAHVPWMKKHMRLIDETALPGAKARLELFDIARTALLMKGYTQIGLDHFVWITDPMAEAYETKTLQRNFQGYTTDSAEALIGFGPSAISALKEGYSQNHTAVADYFRAVERAELPTVKGVAVTTEDKIRRALINELMCYMALNIAEFCTRHAVSPALFDEAHPGLLELAADGLIAFDGNQITVQAEATQSVRLVCALFDTYFQASTARHAQVA